MEYIKTTDGYWKVIDNDFSFEYGVIEVIDFHNNFQKTVYDKCLRCGIHLMCRADEKRFIEVQFIYKDENNKPQCFKGDKNDYHIEVKHQGNMQIEL